MGSLTLNCKLTYDDLIRIFQVNPRDVKTHPTNAAKPKWYFVFVENGNIFISNSKKMQPSVTISIPRKLIKNEFEVMYDLNNRRENGESVAKFAQSLTMNSSYWFGIFNFIKQGE